MKCKVLIIAIIITVLSSIAYAEDRYYVGKTPEQVSLADLDNDGYIDMIVNNYMGYSVSVLMNNGEGNFDDQTVYKTETDYNPSGVASGDLNNDGWIDMVVNYNGSTNLSVYLNKGDGTFEDKVQYNYTAGNNSMMIFDLNNDGWNDIIGPQDYGPIAVFLNNKDGTFQNMSEYSRDGALCLDNIICDIDNDGFSDIILTSNKTDFEDGPYGEPYGFINVLKNKGDGTLVKTWSFITESRYSYLSYADLDHDGYYDIVCDNPNKDNLSVYINKKDGTFLDPVIYDTGIHPNKVTLADINNDNWVDMLISNENSSDIFTFMNNGDGSFAAGAIYPTGSQPLEVVTSDIDNDSWLDMIVSCTSSQDIKIYLNNKDGTFTPKSRYGIGDFYIYYPQTADVNHDGLLDLIQVDTHKDFKMGWISVFRNLGNGIFDNNFINIEYKTDTWIRTGAEFDIFLESLRAFTVEKKVDLYFVLINPQGDVYSGMEWNEGIKPAITGLTLPANFRIDNLNLLHIIIPNEKPPITPATGMYTFAMALFKSGTAELLSNIATTSFDVAQ